MSDATNPSWKEPYEKLSATTTFHNAPRFGHSSDFSRLFSDEEDDRTDYAEGLLFGGLFVLTCFLTWTIILLVLKCLGGTKVGFLSGAPFQGPKNGAPAKRVHRSRIVFLTAGVLFTVFTFVLVALGITQLHDTVNTVDKTNHDLDQILSETKSISASLRSLGQTGKILRAELTSVLGSFCPANPDLEEQTGYNFGANAQDALNLLDDLGDFVDTDLIEVQEGIADAQKTTADVDDGVNDIDGLWQSLLITVPFVVLATLMLVGMTLVWYEMALPLYTGLLVWVIVPLFAIATVFAYILCSGSMLTVVANADFCSGGVEETPDVSVVEILTASGVAENDIVYEAVRYYATQCEAEDPWTFIREYDSELKDATFSVQDLKAAMENNVTVSMLNLLCNENYEPLEIMLGKAVVTLGALQLHAETILEVLSCQRIVPIYTGTAYNGTCDYSIKGLTWTFSSTLVIAFMGMLMLTFRSVLWNVEDGNEMVERHEPAGELGDPAKQQEEKIVADKDKGVTRDDDDVVVVGHEGESGDL